MISFWKRRIEGSVLTENLEVDSELEKIKKELKNTITKKFAGSLAIRMVDSGSCNACEAECNALSNPYYDLERLGIYFVASPRHADVMLLSGVMTLNMLPHVKDTYEQMSAPKWIITLGDCTSEPCPIKKSFAISGKIDETFPVAYHIKGCPPEPKDIILGLLDFFKAI